MNAFAKPRAHHEDDLQKAVVDWLYVQEAMGRLAFFAVPNEGKRSWRTANRMRSLGMRSGVPDLVIVSHFGTAYIELKTPKGRIQDSQRDWEAKITDFGIRHAICRSVDEVMLKVDEWLSSAR